MEKILNSERNAELFKQQRIEPKHKRFYASDAQNLSSSGDVPDYAFEMAASNIRFGPGVTQEIGFDLEQIGVTNCLVFVDPNLAALKEDSPVSVVTDSLRRAGVRFQVFSDISIEPTDSSMKKAIKFAQEGSFDGYVGVGGGSTMDTAKMANLYATYPPSDFYDYVNAPLGKGMVPPGPVKPLIAVPTTAGTGSETTGTAIFDVEEKKFKTGVAHRMLRPLLGLIDPNNTKTLPPGVIANSGFDVLCHSLESFTAIPYDRRAPRPQKPILRPAYQGSNPISDFWCLKALEMTAEYLPRSFHDIEDEEARVNMLLAATYAGISFGNAGVHLCHGMSYPIAGGAHSKPFRPPGYPDKAMIPHGMSVVMTAPAVFRYTASASPARHLQVAKILGATSESSDSDDAGRVLADSLLPIMRELEIPNGLAAVGYTPEDIPSLVQGTLPQHRVTKLAPRPTGEEELHALFADSMTIY